MGWESAITAVFSFLLFLGEAWVSNSPAREKKAEQDDDEKLRKECLDLDANAISLRIDSVLNPASGDTAGISDSSPETGTTSP